jgi:hypothetical protein
LLNWIVFDISSVMIILWLKTFFQLFWCVNFNKFQYLEYYNNYTTSSNLHTFVCLFFFDNAICFSIMKAGSYFFQTFCCVLPKVTKARIPRAAQRVTVWQIRGCITREAWSWIIAGDVFREYHASWTPKTYFVDFENRVNAL